MEAIVLAGGLGTRLRSAVSGLPKCMAPVGGTPFLAYLLEELGSQGVTRVILSVGYLREAVMEWVSARPWPFEIEWAVEEEPLGTGGGIRLALSKAREDRVLVLNGDTFFHVPSLVSLLEVDAPIALALKPMRDFDRYGTVEVEPVIPNAPSSVIPNACEGSVPVHSFREKKPCAEGLVNGGVYALDRHLFEGLDLPRKFSFETAVLEPLAAQGKVAGRVCDGWFIDIGIPEDYDRAQRELPEFRNVLRVGREVLESDADTLFLDRDGVINRYLPEDYVTSWDRFVFLPGIFETMAAWAQRFPRIILVTNQRGVARGRFTRETLDDIHRRMLAEIEVHGGRIDAIYVSTAIPDDDPSRKPQTGMFEAACRDFPGIRPECSLMVGDADSDEAFARGCGMAFVRA